LLLYSNVEVNFAMKIKQELKPVIIVPGIMASYLNKVDDNDEVWPNLNRMVLPGKDSPFYILNLDDNGIPYTNNKLKPTDVFRKIVNQDFLQGLIEELENNGYEENKNLFVFPYDWRLDINWTSGNVPDGNNEIANLKDKINKVKELTSSEKVDIIAHSMGGLLVKKYLKEFGEESVNRFIDIATPHFGAPKAFKALMFGDDMGFNLFGLKLNKNTVKDITQNMPAVYQLLPSRKYFDVMDKDYKRDDYKERYPTNIISISNANRSNKQHPVQKPIALMEYLIKTYTNENETVLDFTMGSGSTLVACQNTNRNGIGIEMDDNYFEIAKKRVAEKELNNKDLFNQ